jgi:hypothetical protein
VNRGDKGRVESVFSFLTREKSENRDVSFKQNFKLEEREEKNNRKRKQQNGREYEG